jgi:hypothetical protein
MLSPPSALLWKNGTTICLVGFSIARLRTPLSKCVRKHFTTSRMPASSNGSGSPSSNNLDYDSVIPQAGGPFDQEGKFPTLESGSWQGADDHCKDHEDYHQVKPDVRLRFISFAAAWTEQRSTDRLKVLSRQKLKPNAWILSVPPAADAQQSTCWKVLSSTVFSDVDRYAILNFIRSRGMTIPSFSSSFSSNTFYYYHSSLLPASQEVGSKV